MKIAIVNLITRTPTNHKVPVIESNKDAMIVKLAQELSGLNHEVDLYISDLYRPIKNEELGVNIIYLRTYMRGLPEIPFVPSLIGYLKNNYDVVLSSEAFQWATIFIAASRLLSRRKKFRAYIWQELSVHQRVLKKLPSKFFHRVILRFFLNWQIDKYIPRGSRACQFLISEGVNVSKVVSPVPHGVDSNIFYPDRTHKDKKYIFCPSRLVDDKGIDTVLKAFYQLLQAGLDINLIIQGDGPGYEKYKRIATSLDIIDVVYFNRKRADHHLMREFYSNAELSVIASRQDFMLFSVMESLVCGTPVVISDAIDISEEVSVHGGGEVFEYANEAMLFDTMLKLLTNKKNLSSARDAAISVKKIYTNKAVANALVRVFAEPVDC